MEEAMFKRSTDYFEKFRKNFCFLFKGKPKLGIEFPNDMVLAYIHSHMMDFATHLQTTINTFLHIVWEKVTRVNLKVIYYPVYLNFALNYYQTAMEWRYLGNCLKN